MDRDLGAETSLESVNSLAVVVTEVVVLVGGAVDGGVSGATSVVPPFPPSPTSRVGCTWGLVSSLVGVSVVGAVTVITTLGCVVVVVVVDILEFSWVSVTSNDTFFLWLGGECCKFGISTRYVVWAPLW